MNKVLHFEIPAKDYEKAKRFYSEIFGWRIEEWPGTPSKYGMATTTPTGNKGPIEPGGINGAVYEAKDGDTTVVTIDVPSIDEYLKKITAAGGKIKRAKDKVGDMGYVATFEDPNGITVGLWETIQK